MARKLSLGLLLLWGGALLLAVGGWLNVRSAAALEATPWSDRVIRLHVVANSDSEQDQELKRAVRDAIVDAMAPHFEKARSMAAARAAIQAATPEMERIAAKVVAQWGKHYDVHAEIGQVEFPGKAYGSLFLPAGNYTALRVMIGEAKGANWWCVLWPPLCFTDWTTGVVREPKPGSAGTQTITLSRKDLIAADEEELAKIEVRAEFALVNWVKSLRGHR